MRRLSKRGHQDADVDVTSFINLVVVLVPVLLMGMVLSHITVLDLKLPDLAVASSDPSEPPKQLEVVLRADYMDINFPAGVFLKRIEKKDGKYDFASLSLYLQEIKRRLAEQGTDKRDISLLSEKSTEYETIVSAMDTLRSFRARSGGNYVNAELFPEVSLLDAPAAGEQMQLINFLRGFGAESTGLQGA